MRFTEFNKVNEAAEAKSYYAIGDSIAGGLAAAGGSNWGNLSAPGTTTSSPNVAKALSSIPPGSVVALSVGMEDAKSVEMPEQIGARVASIVSDAKKHAQVVYVLFPASIAQGAERLQAVRSAILSSLGRSVPILDMEKKEGGVAPFDILANQIMMFIKPTSQMIGQAGQGSRPMTGSADMSSAKASAERYLGSRLSDSDWDMLIRATSAEASGNNREQGWVMGTILNRVRSGKWGNSLRSVLYAKNQFQSVTGTPKHRVSSPNFVRQPPQARLNSILSAAANVLPEVPHSIINFTAASRAAYGAGTNIGYLKQLYARGGERIGGTVFSA